MSTDAIARCLAVVFVLLLLTPFFLMAVSPVVYMKLQNRLADKNSPFFEDWRQVEKSSARRIKIRGVGFLALTLVTAITLFECGKIEGVSDLPAQRSGTEVATPTTQ